MSLCQTNSDLVVFGEDWGRHPSSTQHLMKRLAVDRRVVWVNSIGMRRPGLDWSDMARLRSKLQAWRRDRSTTNSVSAATPEMPAVDILAPMAMPWPGSRTAEYINKIALRHQIGTRLRAKGMARPILWASLPTALPAVGELGEKAVVYYCGDDFSALAGVDHGPVLEMEQRLVEKADLILAASPTLAARFPSNKTKFLPHGADIDLFATPTPRAVDLPMDRPVAGFYGSLSGWIDVALLGRVAQSLPDWWVVLIGDVRTDVSAIARLDNVRLLGPRPHDALPSYSQHWTASLLPFRDCPQITACNPLKLREYLAAGRPVVSTPFPALAPYGGVVMQAESAGAFVGCLRQSLDDDARNVSARRAAIAGETWEARAAMVNHALRIL